MGKEKLKQNSNYEISLSDVRDNKQKKIESAITNKDKKIRERAFQVLEDALTQGEDSDLRWYASIECSRLVKKGVDISFAIPALLKIINEKGGIIGEMLSRAMDRYRTQSLSEAVCLVNVLPKLDLNFLSFSIKSIPFVRIVIWFILRSYSYFSSSSSSSLDFSLSKSNKSFGSDTLVISLM